MNYDTTKPYKKQILEAIQSTWETPYAKAFMPPGSPYPIITTNYYYKEQVDHTDGIGTKGALHYLHRTFASAVQDALAMNLNDLLVVRARPYKLQNHLIIEKDDHPAILEIVNCLAKECKARNIILSGGETSIQENMRGMDLSLTVSGFVPNAAPQNEFQIGDALIGISSSGAHSNGFTYLRKLFGEMWPKLTEPTKVYWDIVYPLFATHNENIHGLAHIAGGGFTRLLDHLNGSSIFLYRNAWPDCNPIFSDYFKYKQDDEFMYKTFNCGVGMVLSVSQDKAEEIAKLVNGEIIGVVSGGENRLHIESIFSNKTITLYKE
jgi:phosphoribosylformylglycinamidine cyclo-ligase